MNNFLVLVITQNLFNFLNIVGFFEEEESISFVETINNTPGNIIALNIIAADLVVYMDTHVNDSLFERVSKKVGTFYVKCDDVEEVKEVIAEKFVEWSESYE